MHHALSHDVNREIGRPAFSRWLKRTGYDNQSQGKVLIGPVKIKIIRARREARCPQIMQISLRI